MNLDDENKDEAYINSQLGWCHRQAGEYEKAIEYDKKAKELGRNDVWINVEIGMCYAKLEEYEKGAEIGRASCRERV